MKRIAFFLFPLLTACAALIVPNVIVLPGRGIPPDKFVADDEFCKDAASKTLRWMQYSIDATYMQCMISKGHQVPGITRDMPPAPPPPRNR